MNEENERTAALARLHELEDAAMNARARVHAIMETQARLREDLKEAQSASRLAQGAYTEAWGNCLRRGYVSPPERKKEKG